MLMDYILHQSARQIVNKFVYESMCPQGQFKGHRSQSKMGDSGQSRLRLRLQANSLTPIPTPVAKKVMTLTPAPTPVARKVMTLTPAPTPDTLTPIPTLVLTPIEYNRLPGLG